MGPGESDQDAVDVELLAEPRDVLDRSNHGRSRLRVVVYGSHELDRWVVGEIAADSLDHHPAADDEDAVPVALRREAEPTRTGTSDRDCDQADQSDREELRRVDLTGAVDAVNQNSGTEREEPTDRHRVADPAEISKGFLAKAPVALLVEPVDRKSKKRHEREREVVQEVLAEELQRVRRLSRNLCKKREPCNESDRQRDEVGHCHQPVAVP